METPSMAMERYFPGSAAKDPTLKALTEMFDAPLVKDIPRGMLKVQTPGAQVNTAPFRAIWGFGLLVLLDLAMHAAAGAAAVSAGAKGNGLPVTTRAVQLGALAAITKAGITTFGEVLLKGNSNFAFWVLMLLLTSSFGICPLLVTEVGSLSLGEAPKELLIAAVVAAVPLSFETIRDIEPKPDDEGNIQYLRWVFAIFLIPMDALGGYVFARMASNQDMPISNFPAACSAGAAFGTLTFLARAMTGCIAMLNFTTATGGKTNIFGTWEFVVPDPVIMSQEDYQKMQDGVTSAINGAFKVGPKIFMRPLKFAAGVLACCCPCWPIRLRDGLEDMEESFGTMQDGMNPNMVAAGAMFIAQGMMGRVVAIGDGDNGGGFVVGSASSEDLIPGRITDGSEVGSTSPAESPVQASGHPGQASTELVAPPQATTPASSEQKIDPHLAAQIGR